MVLFLFCFCVFCHFSFYFFRFWFIDFFIDYFFVFLNEVRIYLKFMKMFFCTKIFFIIAENGEYFMRIKNKIIYKMLFLQNICFKSLHLITLLVFEMKMFLFDEYHMINIDLFSIKIPSILHFFVRTILVEMEHHFGD